MPEVSDARKVFNVAEVSNAPDVPKLPEEFDVLKVSDAPNVGNVRGVSNVAEVPDVLEVADVWKVIVVSPASNSFVFVKWTADFVKRKRNK